MTWDLKNSRRELLVLEDMYAGEGIIDGHGYLQLTTWISYYSRREFMDISNYINPWPLRIEATFGWKEEFQKVILRREKFWEEGFNTKKSEGP